MSASVTLDISSGAHIAPSDGTLNTFPCPQRLWRARRGGSTARFIRFVWHTRLESKNYFFFQVVNGLRLKNPHSLDDVPRRRVDKSSSSFEIEFDSEDRMGERECNYYR